MPLFKLAQKVTKHYDWLKLLAWYLVTSNQWAETKLTTMASGISASYYASMKYFPVEFCRKTKNVIKALLLHDIL